MAYAGFLHYKVLGPLRPRDRVATLRRWNEVVRRQRYWDKRARGITEDLASVWVTLGRLFLVLQAAVFEFFQFDLLPLVEDGLSPAEDGFDFLKAVPTAWDETRFIGGTPESYVVMARRKGKIWYVGAITNEQGRDVDISLSFLPTGKFIATLWQDGVSTNSVNRTQQNVTRGQTVKLALSPGGGVIMLEAAAQ